jgi:hypothetical protein
MANLGARAASPAAFSHIEKWKGSEAVVSEALAGRMDVPLTVVGLVRTTKTANQRVTAIRRMG